MITFTQIFSKFLSANKTVNFLFKTRKYSIFDKQISGFKTSDFYSILFFLGHTTQLAGFSVP